MTDMSMHHDGGDGAAETKGTATLAMFLWVVVTLALVYGLYNTFIKVVDLFTG